MTALFKNPQLAAITLFSEDLALAREFYQEALGLPLIFEDTDSAVFKLENTLINLLAAGAGRELITPAEVADPGTGARAQLTIEVEVEDVDAVAAELAERGVRLLNGPMDRPWGLRTACFADPNGHVWEIAASLAD